MAVLSPRRGGRRAVADLVGEAYSAAAGAEPWERFLESLTRATDSTMSALLVIDPASSGGSVSAFWGVDANVIGDSDRHDSKVNPVLETGRSRGLLAPGTVRRSHEVIAFADLSRSKYYARYRGTGTPRSASVESVIA